MPKYEGETKIYFTDGDGRSHELHFENGSWHAHDNVDECRKGNCNWDDSHRELTEEEKELVEVCNKRLEGN